MLYCSKTIRFELYHGASIIEIGEKEFVMKISMLPLEGKNDI